MTIQEGWDCQKKILVIMAHPDDPEFFCGGSIARWNDLGHLISYSLFTRGDKGSSDGKIDVGQLAEIRELEQRAAGAVLGVNRVDFMNFKDGCLIPDLFSCKTVVAIIRKEKPDIVVTSDPTNYFPSDEYINHSDHRAAGETVLNAVFPASGNPHFFPELLEEGLMPHTPEEVWCAIPTSANFFIDVTDFWEIKILALLEHRSQIGDIGEFKKRMVLRRTQSSSELFPRFEEQFKRIVFRKVIGK